MTPIQPVHRSPVPVAVAVAAVIGVLVFMATAMVSPLNGEDFALTRDMGGLSAAERLGWMAERSFTQITQWNARLGEQLAIFWLGVPRIYFALVATASLLLFCMLSAGWARDPKDRNSFVNAALHGVALIWLFWPGYEVFFWTTAQAAYFQPMLLVLLLLSFYLTPAAVQRLHASNLSCLAAAVVALLVGTSFENVPPAVGVSIGIVLLLNGRHVWNLRTTLPVILLAVAWLMLMLAPSTGIRRAAYAAMYPAAIDVGHYLLRLQNVLGVLLSTSWLIIAAATASSLYLWKWHGWRQQLVIVWLVSSMTVATVVAAPYTEPRAFIVAWALWYVTVVAAVVRLAAGDRFNSLVALIALAALWLPVRANLTYVEFSRSLQERDSYIRVMSRTGNCESGIAVGHNAKVYPYKYLNNRESWFVANPGYVSNFYGCKVSVR